MLGVLGVSRNISVRKRVEGSTAAELLARVPEDQRDALERRHRARVAGAKDLRTQLPRTLVRPDGKQVVVDLSIRPMRFRGRAARQLVLVDRTERELLEAQVRQQQKMEAIGTLAGGIAHDFNNLLTGILGMANILRTSASRAAVVESAATTIEQAAEQAAALTSQLVRIARAAPPS